MIAKNSVSRIPGQEKPLVVVGGYEQVTWVEWKDWQTMYRLWDGQQLQTGVNEWSISSIDDTIQPQRRTLCNWLDDDSRSSHKDIGMPTIYLTAAYNLFLLFLIPTNQTLWRGRYWFTLAISLLCLKWRPWNNLDSLCSKPPRTTYASVPCLLLLHKYFFVGSIGITFIRL